MQGDFNDSRVSCMCIYKFLKFEFYSHRLQTLEFLETYKMNHTTCPTQKKYQ